MCSCTLHKTFVEDAGLIGQGGSFGRTAFLSGKRHQNTRRSYMTASADLEPPTGLGFGIGSGLGLGWSGSTCKVEIGDTRTAQSFV